MAPTPEQMTPEQRDAAFAMAGQEMEYRVELFNKMVASCYEKCVSLAARRAFAAASRARTARVCVFRSRAY